MLERIMAIEFGQIGQTLRQSLGQINDFSSALKDVKGQAALSGFIGTVSNLTLQMTNYVEVKNEGKVDFTGASSLQKTLVAIGSVVKDFSDLSKAFKANKIFDSLVGRSVVKYLQEIKETKSQFEVAEKTFDLACDVLGAIGGTLSLAKLAEKKGILELSSDNSKTLKSLADIFKNLIVSPMTFTSLGMHTYSYMTETDAEKKNTKFWELSAESANIASEFIHSDGKGNLAYARRNAAAALNVYASAVNYQMLELAGKKPSDIVSILPVDPKNIGKSAKKA
jgi:hypothetical protein